MGLAWGVPARAESRLTALLGVTASVAAGGVALWLKGRAFEGGVGRALALLGVTFGVRLALVAGLLLWASRAGYSPVPLVAGFLGEYVVLQWIEIGYVLAEQKRRSRGGM
jgi:hypothetical protein